MISRWAAAVGLSVLGLAAEARAEGTDETTTLETNLARETKELSTSDCIQACRALASIRRAADRICELQPGTRCDAARAKADDATKRVREACPECAVAGLPAPKEDRAPAMAPPQATVESEKAAPSGGCRSCATTSSHVPDGGDLAVFALAALVLTRRSKKDRRRL